MYKLIQLNDPVTISDKRMPSNCPEGVPVFLRYFLHCLLSAAFAVGVCVGVFQEICDRDIKRKTT